MIKINVGLMKGLRDFLPDTMRKRNYVINVIKEVFENFGFSPIETPAMEYWEVLSGKYGDEVEKLIYRFKDRGDRDIGLRYDLTLPLSRIMTMYRNQIIKPLKRYQIQPVWRADKPGKGRFREFYQCDVDIVGSKDLLADAEVIAVAVEALKKLGFRNFVTKINTRKILRGIVEIAGADLSLEAQICRSIDKLDKIGFEGVEKELLERGVSPESKDKIIEIIKIKGNPQEVTLLAYKKLEASAIALEGLEDLSRLRKYLTALGIPEENFQPDLSLSRGLDYYTGPIFETVVEKPSIGSITGGGRYDNLMGIFSGQETPATGNSIGLERIITVMDELDMYPPSIGSGIHVLLCRFPDEDLNFSLNLCQRLRDKGINTEIYLGSSQLRGQLGYAQDKGIPVVLIPGGSEIQEGKITLKDMKQQTQETIPLDHVVSKIREIIKREENN